MLAIPELLDRWILKNLANYPGVYYVTGGKKHTVDLFIIQIFGHKIRDS